VSEIIEVRGLSNAEFYDRFAAPGRIGLVGGAALIDRVIAKAQRHLDAERNWSRWSHAFLLQGRRADGQHWVVESDLDIHKKHIRLGVQENRLSKFHDEAAYSTVAVLDLGLDESAGNRVLAEALELTANHTRYSIRELVGTLLALRHPERRASANRLARDRCLFCSAFVQQVFRRAGVDLFPGLDAKLTTPEDLWRSPVTRTAWILEREVARPVGERVGARLRRVAARVRLRRRGIRRRLKRGRKVGAV
jgi:hypothetical protein